MNKSSTMGKKWLKESSEYFICFWISTKEKKTISIWIPFSIRFSNWIVLNFFPDDGFEIINHDDLNNKFRRILPIFISASIFYQDFVFSESILRKRYWNDLLGGHFKFCRSFLILARTNCGPLVNLTTIAIYTGLKYSETSNINFPGASLSPL